MDEKILDILKELQSDIKEMKTDIKDLKQGQEKIISKLDEVESVNANRHVEIMKDFNDIKDDLNNVEIITSKNWNDIARLKAVK